MAEIQVGRAQALVGTRFRPQGRSPQHGLDCVGLLLCAFDLPREVARSDYRLRGKHRTEIEQGLRASFRRIPTKWRRAGDVLLLGVAQDQLHLAIASEDGFVHADARLGRVVETPGPPHWPILGVYRRRKARI
jgi:murein DD-endopeptidase / murein LD-carboxypeptidase